MNQQPTYNPLELLRRWVRGETPLGEERQLEQLAEEDSFLAEALEGYRLHPEGQHAERVERVKARLRERSRKKRGGIFYLPRLAAAAIALALTVGGFWYINQDGANLSAFAIEEKQAEKSVDTGLAEIEKSPAAPPAAKTETAPSPPAQQKGQEVAREQAPQSKVREEPLTPKKALEKPKGRPAASAPEERQIAQAEPLPAPLPSPQPPTTADELQQYSLDDKETAISAEEGAVDAVQNLTAKTRMQPAAPQTAITLPPSRAGKRKITGYVQGENGEPLIGANVVLEGTQQGTVTDIDGQFELELPDGFNQNLVFAYTGYESLSINPGDKDSLAIVLPEGGAVLESVTVTGYSAARKEAADMPPPPRPENGFSNLRQYIRDNLKYPGEARERGIEGKVKLSFRIRADGSLYDFNIEKRLGYGCDEEAIRLLKEGPKWEGAGQAAEYTVRFKR
ncbi:MAG: TonB family protein [Lewinellaceae bacterium]|nr:TonB family protein [Phaeodactylibacter sp.]MCB9042037.1 TonB family protein [Lewinellaceae bacterium]